mmetsp:Transcript_60381/g.155621  ORF Transcript_60381/g.155621 Transcript_60381/m.155621 type:complete len:573 (+) Transcript_60381:78-1796(+)
MWVGGGTVQADLDTEALVAQLCTRLPRLLFAAVDAFPLAGGVVASTGAQCSVLAVRAVPVDERLDAGIVEQLGSVVHGRGNQKCERLLNLCIPHHGAGQDDIIHVAVCWHDITDFAALVLKGNPSAVDALASRVAPLYSTHEWASLQAICTPHVCASLMAGKGYRNACAGAALRLTTSKRRLSNQQLAEKDQKAAEATGEVLASEFQDTVALLCKRASIGCSHTALTMRLDELAVRPDAERTAWYSLATELMAATHGFPETAEELPGEAVRAWVDGIRQEDFRAYAVSCSDWAAPEEIVSAGALPPEWAERLAPAWPQGAELLFMVQSGSFMYDLHTAASDEDYTIVFASPPENLLASRPPHAHFEHHAPCGFAEDKSGEIEFSGRELGNYLVELAKGNAKVIELLFTEKPHISSPVWRELRARRRGFLTLRCAKQYLGFISERLQKATADLQQHTARDAFDEASARRLSKYLYHAHHKILELGRVLAGGEPSVALVGDERDFVLELRLRPPGTVAEAHELLTKAEARRHELSGKLNEARETGSLPAEVCEDAVGKWLRSVRARQAVWGARL